MTLRTHLRTGMKLMTACALAAMSAACMTQTGSATDPRWPASPDFAHDSRIPNQMGGESHNGWVVRGGSWVTDRGPGGEQLWQVIYDRDDATTVAIVTPDERSADGSITSWRVRQTLLFAPGSEVPMTWESCQLVSGELQPVYARWAPGREPADVWTFHPRQGRFEHLAPADVTCTEFGPE